MLAYAGKHDRWYTASCGSLAAVSWLPICAGSHWGPPATARLSSLRDFDDIATRCLRAGRLTRRKEEMGRGGGGGR